MEGICSTCYRELATVFCCCVFPLPFLCNECANYHIQKSAALHTIRPVAEAIGIQSRRDLHEISMRLVNMRAGEEALRSNLGLFDVCANEIEGKFGELIRRITEIKQAKLYLLQEIKRRLNESINDIVQDAMNHLIDIPGKPDFQTDLARKVCNFVPELYDEFILFKYSVSDPDPRLEQLIKVVMRPMNIHVKTTLLEKPTLTLVSKNVLHKFDVKTETWSSLDLVGTDVANLRVEWDTVSAPYDDGIGLLCCGGGSPASNAAYRIDMSTGEVEKLNDMQVGRSGHGLVQYKSVFYAFGGEGSERSAEKYEDGQWELFMEMYSRHKFFVPCVHNDLIYLVGGESRYIETFDPVRRVFERWVIDLPERLADTSLSSAFLGDDILILSTKYLGRWSDDHLELTVRKYPKAIRAAWSNMTPIFKWSYAVYLANQKLGHVMKFVLSTLRYVEFKVPQIPI